MLGSYLFITLQCDRWDAFILHVDERVFLYVCCYSVSVRCLIIDWYTI